MLRVQTILLSPAATWWTILLSWIAVVASLSLLLRNHLFPWLLARLSKHLRVRSVSLWSIRGLYLRTGTQTYRIDRVGYGWSSGFNVKLHGLTLEVTKPQPTTPLPRVRRHNRRLTLADLSPTPLAHRVLSQSYSLFEPHVRPLARTLAVAGLRMFIRWLPQIISKVSFEFHETSLTAPELPGTVHIEKISLHANLSFTQLEKMIDAASLDKSPRSSRLKRTYSMAAWKQRLTNSFQRTLNRAWGQAQGTASFKFTLHNVKGSNGADSPAGGKFPDFFHLPGGINFQASLGFNPREATLDKHSLKVDLDVGDSFVVLDALDVLLKNLQQFQSEMRAFRFPDNSTPSSSRSLFSLSSAGISPNTPNSELLFSPISSATSLQAESPLSSALEPSDGYISPSSPLFEVLSASLRARRRNRYRVRRLKDNKDQSLLSVLGSANIKVSTITFSAPLLTGGGRYRGVVQGVAITSGLCNDQPQNDLRRRWLGKRFGTADFGSDSYGIHFSVRHIYVERYTTLHSLRILTLGEVTLQALATQWPAPWINPSPFMSGDPNAPFLAISAKIEGLDVTERVEHLRQLVAHLDSVPKPPRNQSNSLPASLRTPRIVFELEHGVTRGRLICANPDCSEPLIVELRNNGFVVSANSHFTATGKGTEERAAVDFGKQPLRMDYNIMTLFKPTHLKVRSKASMDTCAFTSLKSSDPDFLNDPSIFSADSFEIHGAGHALAFLMHDSESMASVNSSSPILDLHVSTPALCVELWHPHIMTAIYQMLSLIPPPPLDARSSSPPQPPLLDRMPTGVSVTFALERFVIIVTSPDINPRDTLALSRGIVCSTTMTIDYSSMHSGHTHRFQDLFHRTQIRHKLHLPQELLVDAVSAARASIITRNASAHIRVSLSGTVLRNAVTTQYDVASASILEADHRGSHHPNYEGFLRIPKVTITVCYTGKRGSVPSKSSDGCEISGVIPEIRANVHLAYLYDILLALESLRSLVPVSPARSSGGRSPHRLIFRFKGTMTTVQVLCKLPTQMLALRIDGIDVHNSPEGLTLRLGKGVGWVQLPSRINRWDHDHGDKWEELLYLQMLNISCPSTPSATSVAVDGDSARLRIPFGFVFADLVTDLTVTIKAAKHLLHITSAKTYTPMPTPEPEGPKIVPRLSIHIRCLCLEAADDSFESKLAVIWRCGLAAAKQRNEREAAFSAKVAAILQSESQAHPLPLGSPEPAQDYDFNAKHSVTVEEARRRLDETHELDWTLRLRNLRQQRSDSEDAVHRSLHSKHAIKGASTIPNIVEVSPTEQIPPLLRALFTGLVLSVGPPSFPMESLSDFLHQQGGGLPYETQYSSLVPLNLDFSLTALQINLRDYPLPLLSIPPKADSKLPTWTFKTDLVIAEEMGSELSVEWIDCLILEQDYGISGAPSLSISIPKTIMPVKSYANANVHVTSSVATLISWGVSYTPAIQDLMRVIETLSSPPKDSSPGVGFWDKIKLVFHWTLAASFDGEVRLHMKGSRDPYKLSDEGAGFVLSWQKNVKLLVGENNKDGELVQITSDSMFIAIPNFEHLYPRNQRPSFARRIPDPAQPFRKICAKLRSGVRFGVGFVLERSCGIECLQCFGSAFHRSCRHFNFRPHYDIKLEKKAEVPIIKGRHDSYNRFRSDFIHLSISLVSSVVDLSPTSSNNSHECSSIHLTPKAFAHFWLWCALFDSAFSLPTRQGSYYPSRVISPKLGRHLATLKYRVQIHRLYVMHAYIHESRETWVDGVIPWVGVKGMIDEFHVDMHQREEEIMSPDSMKVMRRKPLYAAEVALKGLDLRALLATFQEPLRQSVEMAAPPQRSNYRAYQDLPSTGPSSPWHDHVDFIETDWSPSTAPQLHLLPVMTCPHFTYFKRNSATLSDATQASKFGLEQSHTCLLGREQSVPQVQISIVSARIDELKRMISIKRLMPDGSQNCASLEKMINLLEDYVALLQEIDNASIGNGRKPSANYVMPSFTVSPDEWVEFENVYQLHCPTVYISNAIRDIMMQYYYSSQARKGLEYRMATRAVKFIRDQAELALDDDLGFDNDAETTWDAVTAAHIALKRVLRGDNSKHSMEVQVDRRPPGEFDPLDGWSEGISLSKSHCCLLLKPQVVLRGEGTEDALIVAALQAKLQAFAIMDENNADDPVSGTVMSRSLTSVSGLQTFAPVGPATSKDTPIPIEVLIDLRCRSDDFDCLVPQTDATLHYDKFNRLRLRNSVTSVTKPSIQNDNHLQDQTDLVRVHIPRFTVSANDAHFKAISHIVTKLVLFSDAAHKTRLDKLETLLFTYDFTDLASAANIVAELRHGLNDAIESQQMAVNNHSPRLEGEEGQLELLKLKAHIFLLSEELNFVFDAIKLAQDRFDDHTDQKSALLLHASSSEISWRMLDERKDLLSKLVVQNIDFFWLSRQDGATCNNLTVGNLEAFDGSRSATWAEILSKHNDPPSHPLLKRGLFLLASWTVLAPVGGITIYESFELSLHPMRLQIDARVGRRIMEYVWPARRRRHQITGHASEQTGLIPPKTPGGRTSLDSPRALHNVKNPPHPSATGLAPPLRKLGTSRSFTDLRDMARDTLKLPTIHKLPSTETLQQITTAFDIGEGHYIAEDHSRRAGDAAEMKNRASQKSFVLVRISSMHLLLSIATEGSFECRDAHIRTRDLEYRNQTWSFEELVNQFIPTDTSWKGWVKMAFHQPLLPVLPVARELISKTKLIASTRAGTQVDAKGPPPKLNRARALSTDDDSKLAASKSSSRGWRKELGRKPEFPAGVTALPLTDEPESIDTGTQQPGRRGGRKRLQSLFNRSSSKVYPQNST